MFQTYVLPALVVGVVIAVIWYLRKQRSGSGTGGVGPVTRPDNQLGKRPKDLK